MRRILAAAVLGAVLSSAGPAREQARVYPTVLPGTELRFPRDHGAHPEHRIEWWYVTGWLDRSGAGPLGFQITFFRVRPITAADNPSRFAPRQILFAHTALTDPATGRLIHDQRSAREGFGIAAADREDARVKLLGWSFSRAAGGEFQAKIPAREFTLDLRFAPTQPVLLNGAQGYSRKGPSPREASYYYSMPQLRVRGTVVRRGRQTAVTGTAWMDREWSSSLLPPNAVGWDWTAINFDDGGALMAFQVRGDDGGEVYAGGTYRAPDGVQSTLTPDDVQFKPRRRWRSPATGAVYPVEAEFLVRLPSGVRRVPLKPLLDDQELVAGQGVMPSYWEGAVSTPGGRGYLELTGYSGSLPD